MIAFSSEKEDVLENVNSSLNGLSSIDAKKRLEKKRQEFTCWEKEEKRVC